ncbi:alpha/beta hydrolase [Xanthobacter autotrophicus DSM 431]|uniref:alpha/beta fold hydrolase n=1 Tax=Xanthobacter nonsaccharivorans TaxID=3119912 RepID=UPI003729C277
MTGRERSTFVVSDGLKIAADVAGPKGGRPVLLLHGGGQTRGSWRDTIDILAANGHRAYALDARGHGESDWSPNGEYTPESFSRDLRDVIRQIGDEIVVIGASLGGIIGLLVAGEGGPLAVSSLVLVDVAVRTNPYGVKRIQSFMQANPGGFASLDEAADAVAAYAVDRPRPKSNDGLLRNLRQIDGRYYWHWDPRFLESWHPSHAAAMDRLEAAARGLKIPVLLIHASRSDVMGEEEVAHLRALAPQAEYARVESAGHMVVGDKNSVFNKEITQFLSQGADVD